jgi:hypothetical protein
MNVGAPIEANGEAAELVQPGNRSLDNPPVAPESVRGLDAAPGDARHDAAKSARETATIEVVALVGVEARGAATRSTSRPVDRRNLLEQVAEQSRVVDVRG